MMGFMLTSPLYPRSAPFSPKSQSFSYYFNCICNYYNAQSSNSTLINSPLLYLNLCLQMVSGKWREMLQTCTKTLMWKQPRHAFLRCSCLKHACLDLLCKRALKCSLFILAVQWIAVRCMHNTAMVNKSFPKRDWYST